MSINEEDLNEAFAVFRDLSEKNALNPERVATTFFKLPRPAFSEMLSEVGIPFNGIIEAESLWSNPPGLGPVTSLSWTVDNKVLFVDTTNMANNLGNTKFPWTELAMCILQRKGVDVKKVLAIGRPDITNASTLTTIESIFKHLKESGPTIRLLRKDTTERYMAFDAFLRTREGTSTIDLLSYYCESWGWRNIKEVIIRRDMDDGEGTNALIVLD